MGGLPGRRVTNNYITLRCHSSSGQSSREQPARNKSPKPDPGDQGKARLADMPQKN